MRVSLSPKTALIGAILALSYCNFFPFPSDVEAYAKESTQATTAMGTALGYLRYLLLLVCSVGLVRELTSGTGLNVPVAIKTLTQRFLWLPLLTLLTALGAVGSTRPDILPLIIQQVLWFPAVLFAIVTLRSPKNYTQMLFISLTLCLFLSYVGVLLAPDNSTHMVDTYSVLNEDLHGLWRGMFQHKNVAGGAFMILALVAALLFPLTTNKAFCLIVLIMSGLFIAQSGSVSSVAAPLLAIFLIALLSAHPRGLLPALLPDALATSYIAFPFVTSALLATLDSVFDGRELIWRIASEYGGEASLFGHGYLNGFGSVDMERHVTDDWISFIGHAHSGVMDTYLQFGMLGLACLYWMVSSVTRTFVSALGDRSDIQNRNFNRICFTVFLAALFRSSVEPDIVTLRGGFLILLSASLSSFYYAYWSNLRARSHHAQSRHMVLAK